MPRRLPADYRRSTVGFDSSEGLLMTSEVAELFGVTMRTVRKWAKEAMAAEISERRARVQVLRTPGGDWRFSKKWARQRLEDDRG